jgi:hypothetical protein
MARQRISRLVVVDEDGHAVGIVSLTDILAKEARGRALDTARQVLARESEGPHAPLESIHLTPGPAALAGDGSVGYEGSGAASGFDGVIAGGDTTRSLKEFPR